ncbi:MAG: ABC transporter ATP-binding protein [Emergencia sp.]|nr:ABC transporter ATP-binding protein [Emergencia sp.]
MNVLELCNVSKRFGTNRVLEGLSFSVSENRIFGFIGENGAGKTTTMKLILGLMQPDSGEIRVQGEKVAFGSSRTNGTIGYLPDVPEFYDFLTPAEYLHLCGKISGMAKAEREHRVCELLELVGLAGKNKRIHGFSRGMKQRLGIAQALLSRPKLLICDEPTSALDPAGRREILDILSEVKSQTTVLFSTHILSDVERICDEFAFLHDGKIAMEGTMEQIGSLRASNGIEVEFCSGQDAAVFAERHPEAARTGNCRLLFADKGETDMPAVLDALSHSGLAVQRVEQQEPRLEDLFMEVMGR